jgi:hypothetical protein
MSVDISDLPKPSQTDISDLPTPKSPSAPKGQTTSPEKPFGDRLRDIGGATAFGTAAGAFSPEIVMGTGMLLEKFPGSPPPVKAAGKAMQAAVPSMEGAKGRALGALSGGFGSLTGETAGQTAEVLGAPPWAAETARFVGGLAPVEFVTSAPRALLSATGRALGIPGAGMVRDVMKDVGVANLSGQQRELVLQRINELRQSPFATDAQKKIYDTISDSVRQSNSLAEVEADLARRAAEIEAKGVRSSAEQVSREERERGVKLAGTRAELEEAKRTLVDRAKSGLRQVGDATVELSQMGRTLRDRILQRFETGSLERSDAYKKQKALRDQDVANKESKGIFVDSTPEYKELLKDLTSKLLIGRQPLTKKTAEVTEPGVESAYRKIYDAITNKRVMIEGSADDVANYVAELKAAGISVRQGTNPKTGEPVFYREYKTSFDAMDDVRRKLGDAAFGKEAEGYEALGQKIAQEYYAKISNLQSKFAGQSHDVLQSEYEIASRLLEKYRTKAGAKATALDRIDPTQFKADAKSLPGALFNSQQSVADAIALTGDRNLVVQEARNYVARTIANMDAKAAKNWLTSKQNSDWLSALPEVRTVADNYVMNLERAEGMATGAGKVAARKEALERQAGREAGKALEIGEKEAGKLVTEGEKAATKITDAARKEADTILKTAEPAARVQEIITSGDRTLWDRVAPAIAASPQGKQVLEQAIRQTMADRAQQGVFGAQRFWQTSLKDSLARTGLMPANKINEISQQLDAIANSALPEQQKLTLFGRTIRNIIVTYGAPAAYRGGMSAYEALTGAGKPTSMQPRR